MCNGCGFPAAPGHWTEAGSPTLADRLRARAQRASLLNRLLRPFGMTVHDTHPVPGYRLATLTGATVLVGSVEELWAEAERLAGRPVDPLDPVFLDA